MEIFIVGTQVHHKVYVPCVVYNNQPNTYNAPNYLSWLDHIISSDEVHGLTLWLCWIEYALDYIIYPFANIQF